MTKNAKMIKFMLFVLLLIPIVLFVTGIVQTFVLKSTQNKLAQAQTEQTQIQQEYNDLQNEYDYKTSDEYLEEYYKYHNGYGNEGDVVVEIN